MMPTVYLFHQSIQRCEQPLNGFDRDKLVTGVKARGHRSVQSFDSPDELVPKIAKIAKPGDIDIVSCVQGI